MKRLSYVLMLSTLSLLLGACNPDESGNGKTSKSGGDPIASLSSGDINNSQNSASGNIHESGSIGGGNASSSTPIIDYTEGWSDEVLQVMVPHLGGNKIPFIDLPGRVLATWIEASSSYSSTKTEAHLNILATGVFDAALAGAAKLTYQKAGWEVNFNRDTYELNAEEKKLGLKVNFRGEYDSNDKRTNPVVDVYFNEPFKIPDDRDDWLPATLSVLASIGIASPHALPYLYLGSYAEQITVYQEEGIAVIEGRSECWNTYKTQLLAAARESYPRSGKWVEESVTVYSSSGYSSYPAYKFSKHFSDGYDIIALLYGAPKSYSSSAYTPYLQVYCSNS